MKTEVVSKDVGVRENGARTQVAPNFSPTCPRTKLWKRHYEMENHVGEEA
jgi:hypothetical protein